MNKNHDHNDVDAMFSPGDVRPIAEIEIGPTKHEQFFDKNYKKLILLLLFLGLIVSGVIIYRGLKKDEMHKAGAELVAAFGQEGKLNLDRLDGVIDKFPATASAVSATYMKAQALWQQGRENEGNEQMLSFIANAPNTEWKAHASLILGCHYMSSGKNEEAASQFKSVIDAGRTLFAPPAYLCLGDMARADGDINAAQQYYSELVEKYPDSSFVTQSMGVSEREDLLEVTAPAKLAPGITPVLPSAPQQEMPAAELTLPGK